MTDVTVVGGALVRRGLLLAAQRAHPAEIAGKWELPGGRVEPGEDEAAALRREFAEELGVEVGVGARIGPDLPLSAGKVLRIFLVHLADGQEPQALQHRALRWLSARELTEVDWLPADRAVLPDLQALLDG
ncbi:MULTISPECIES: NUDIX domain-containing protein [Thermocrispum]|jgi:8-oxo-dGTP diphosphatase|uniref:8-oxo-dGTP diphosphatase n=1 Tax=Thermocrispum agreste TaxID=37925 RepID=A0ABD6FJ98_9PSEU|nr:MULTISPECIES: NUDIX domain-containing protein [Thermocrispum]